MLIELYNENTGKYRHINNVTITREYDDQYIAAIIPAAPTVIVLDERGNKIENILFGNNIDGPVVKIDEEIWKVVSADGRVFFTPKAQEEHASDEWLSLLEG